jgi:hypothetical protein
MTKKAEMEMEIRNKVIAGLAIAYEKMLEFKRQKNSVLVIMKENKIVHVKP